MPSLDTLAAYWPGWLSLLIAIILVFNKLAEESSKFASFWGGWARRMHERALTRHRAAMTAADVAQAVQQAIERAREEWQSEENEALKTLTSRLETVSGITREQQTDIKELVFKVRCLTAFTEYESLWHSRLRFIVTHSANGAVMVADLPEHIDYYDFEAMYRVDDNWRKWDALSSFVAQLSQAITRREAKEQGKDNGR